jgi:hypothetical protein
VELEPWRHRGQLHQIDRVAMKTLYHVSGRPWLPGSVIQPGHWGALARTFGSQPGGMAFANIQQAKTMTWEIGLELSRKLAAPTAPSRLDCVFCTEDIPSANTFRDIIVKGGMIYVVQVDEQTNMHTGNYDALTSTPQGALLDVIVAACKSYWTDTPTGIREIIVGGNVTVVGILPPTRANTEA